MLNDSGFVIYLNQEDEIGASSGYTSIQGISIKAMIMEIKNYIPFVKAIAANIHRPLPASIMLDDLVQDGMIGLIMAFRKYDADSGVPFQAFAGQKIKWAILDGLREGDRVAKTTRTQANKVSKAIEQLQATLLRPPSKTEVAKALGVRVGDIMTTLSLAYGNNYIRIDDYFQSVASNDDGHDEAIDIPDSRVEPSDIFERQEIYSSTVDHLKELNVSESRISQLNKSVTKKLLAKFA